MEAAKHPSVSAQFWFSLHALLGQKDWSIGQSNCRRRSECGRGRFSDSVSNILSFYLAGFNQGLWQKRNDSACIHGIHTSKKNAVNYSWWKKSCTIWDVVYIKPCTVNKRINYQPQLVSRISSINSKITHRCIFQRCFRPRQSERIAHLVFCAQPWGRWEISSSRYTPWKPMAGTWTRRLAKGKKQLQTIKSWVSC